MTREQAINSMISHGFTVEQVGDVVRALTYKPRDCANCKHYVVTDTRTNWGSQETTKIYSCERWECKFEPTTKNDLGVDLISRQAVLEMAYAYGNGLEPDGYCVNVEDIQALPSVTPQEPKTGEWIEHFDESGKWYECDQCHTDWGGAVNFCPNCGADMREVEE